MFSWNKPTGEKKVESGQEIMVRITVETMLKTPLGQALMAKGKELLDAGYLDRAKNLVKEAETYDARIRRIEAAIAGLCGVAGIEFPAIERADPGNSSSGVACLDVDDACRKNVDAA